MRSEFRHFSLLIASSILASWVTILHAADEFGAISGVLRSTVDETPIAHANVMLVDAGRYSVTDSLGSFLFSHLHPGIYELHATHVGHESIYDEIEVRVGEVTEVAFRLAVQIARIDPLAITGSRSLKPTSRATVTTHIIEGSAQSPGLQTAADVLRMVPGIDMSGGGAPGLVAGVSIRGADPSQTLVLIDGLRINTAGSTSTLGGVDLGQISADVIERVEVVKGPSSAMYGADAAGGVIQIFTKGVHTARHTDVALTMGRGNRVDGDGGFMTQRYHLFHGRRQGLWDWMANGSVGSNGGHIDNTDASFAGLTGKLIRHHADGIGRTSFRLEGSRRTGGAPGAEGLGQFGAFDLDDRQKDHIVRVGIGDKRQIASGVRFEANTTGQWWHVERLNPVIDAGEFAGDFRSTHQLWTAGPQLFVTHRYLRPLTVGTEIRLERQRDDLFGTETAHVAALFVQNRLKLGSRGEIEFGGRLDRHSIYGTELNPRISALIVVLHNVTVHAALGRAFVAPAFDDLLKPTELFPKPIGNVTGESGNRNLKPERLWSGEAGVRWHRRRNHGEAVFYWSRYRDLIQVVTVLEEIDGRDERLLSLGNLADATISGVEVTQNVRLWGDSDLSLSYNFQDATGKDEDGERGNLVGRLHQKISSDYSLRFPWSQSVIIALRADWQERFFGKGTETVGLKDEPGEVEEGDNDLAAAIGAPDGEWRYLSVGFSADYRMSSGLTLQADVSNLLGEEHQSVFGIPQPGRIMVMGIRKSLQ